MDFLNFKDILDFIQNVKLEDRNGYVSENLYEMNINQIINF